MTIGTDAGGGGTDLRTAANAIEQLARVCGSTAMVVMMRAAPTGFEPVFQP